jgi:hypothetical protein
MFSILIQGYTLEQLNKVPRGFNNNIIWNIAHVIVTQQILVYKLSGLPMIVTDEMVENTERYKKQHFATQVEVDIYHYWHKPWIKQSTTSKRYFTNFTDIHLHWVRAH